jgi:hypothetical protein
VALHTRKFVAAVGALVPILHTFLLFSFHNATGGQGSGLRFGSSLLAMVDDIRIRTVGLYL